jgi:hypothetical protein
MLNNPKFFLIITNKYIIYCDFFLYKKGKRQEKLNIYNKHQINIKLLFFKKKINDIISLIIKYTKYNKRKVIN